MRLRLVTILTAGLSLGACTVGPNYRPPKSAVPTPARFGEAATADADQPAPALAGWWRAYNDPELERLIALALSDSPDIRIAAARIGQARAAERVARAGLLPEIDANGAVNYQRFSKNAGLSSLTSLFGGGTGGGTGGTGGAGAGGGSGGGIAAPGNSIHTYSLGFDASWEIDIFGGTQRQIEGARARTEAAVWNARDAQLSLVAEVADAYFQLRTLQVRELIARNEVDRRQRDLALAENTARSGLLAEGDFVRQRAELASAEAAVGPVVAEGKAAMHAIAVLTGRTPDALIEELAVPRPQMPPPPAVPPGLPSNMLRRRPDIRAAERNLAAATADIGVAVADLYPRFSLTGMAQLISAALSNLFSTSSLQLTGNAAATFPILNFGRRSGAVTGRRAAADEAYQTYRQTVLAALRDVEDALVRIRTEQQRGQAIARGLTDSRRAVAAVEARWRSGLTDFGDVLLARQALFQSEDQMAQSEGTLRRALLSLYKALGGGWENLPLDVRKPGADAAAYIEPRK